MKNVAVFFGGKSTEHDISIISANQVIKILSDTYNIVPIYISKNNDMYTGKMDDLKIFKNFCEKGLDRISFLKNNIYTVKNGKAKFYKKIDIAIPVLHGKYGEDGTIQGFFNMLDIPFVESDVLPSAITLDKVFTKIMLKELNIPTLEYTVIRKGEEYSVESIVEKLKFPLIVKPANLGSNIGISKVENLQQLEDAIMLGNMFDKKLLIEHCLEDFKEYNISVFGNNGKIETSLIEQPLSKEEILTFQDKYKSNNGKGMESLNRIFPADIDSALKSEIENYAKKVYKEFELDGIVRIDFLYKEKLYLNEINSIPGSMAYYLWKDKYTFKSLLTTAIYESERRFKEKNSYKSYFDGSVL